MRTQRLIGVLALSATAGITAQQPPLRTGITYIRVDMYATHDGRPVTDLTADDIEIKEDGVPQRIASFEHVRVAPPGPQETRVEPTSVRESRQAAADPRARVFVIFLDTYHTQFAGSVAMRQPLVRFLDTAIGQDDLVAVMTPEMSAKDLAFGRKTTLIASMLQENWGRRDSTDLDPKEEQYTFCYPDDPTKKSRGIAPELIDRRRERLALDALDDLIVYLGGVREERKAVLTITEGWVFYGPNSELTRDTEQGRAPLRALPPPFGRGRAGNNDSGRGSSPDLHDCEADRLMLSQLDHRQRLMQISERANRANVTFYPVYPRGLTALDAPMGPRRPAAPHVDFQNLETRLENLRLLAANTDGIAVVNTNNIEGGIRRIVDDLSSYYLLGYNSTNAKLDGKFRSISVRVTRPGVMVRARRGYRGPTAEELARFAAPAPASNAASISSVVAGASARRAADIHMRAAVWSPAAAGAGLPSAAWLSGELDASLRKVPAWSAGATADISMVGAAGDVVARATVEVSGIEKAFSVRLPESGTLAAGEYAVRVQVRSKAPGTSPLSDVARVIVPDRTAIVGEAVVSRRGPDTGPRFVPIADLRVHRTDRLRLEHPTSAASAPTARMLDRLGRPMPLPITTSLRADDSGQFRWVVAEAGLAPLAAGDYAIEVTVDSATSVTPFSVVP